MSEFSGLRALVTGGASGIGAAVAERLHSQGALVSVLDRNIDHAASFTVPVQADISSDTEVRRAVEAAAEKLGGIDILINNAGVGAQGSIEDNDDTEWHRVFDINVVGMVRVSRAALPWLRQSTVPSIVNTCSVLSVVGVPQRALYGATKGAVHALTLQMAADHLSENIRVNAVLPGTADTPWMAMLMSKTDDPVATRAALEARQPHGRLVLPEEVAHAITYLASPLAASTTGTAMVVDGGLHSLRMPQNPSRLG